MSLTLLSPKTLSDSALGRSLSALTAASCLLLLTARPDFNPVWLTGPEMPARLNVLNLSPLHPEAAADIIAGLAGEGRLDESTRRQIVAQADGVPLFIEELTKTLLERPAAQSQAAPTPGIPTTLLDSLAARLDRLGPARETAQQAAVLGRDFDYALLQACVPYDEQRLQRDLARLIEAELITPVTPGLQELAAPHKLKTSATAPVQYEFKHALVQQAAYTSLLKQTRQAYHRRAAETLAACFPQVGEIHPEMLAQHFSNAGLPAQAVDLWLEAGERATAQGATLEARTFFDRALTSIQPEDRERRWRALAGREAVLSLRAERAAQQADIDSLLELAEAFADDTRHAQALLRQMRYGLRGQDYRLAQRAATAAAAVARRAGDRELEVHALAGLTHALTSVGERDTARQAAEQTLTRLPGLADEGVQAYALSCVAIYHHFGGELSRAVRLWQQSGQAARRAGDRITETRTFINVGFTYIQLGLYTQARAVLEEALALAEAIGEQGLHAALLNNLSYVNWCLGDQRQALALAKSALLEHRSAAASPFDRAVCQSYLGFFLADVGEWAAASDYLAEARAGFTRIGTNSHGVELQAVEATCLLALGRQDEARQLAVATWAYLSERGAIGIRFLARVYIHVADLFAALAEPGIAPHKVIRAGYRDLMQRADQISDLEWRRSFLENVAENRTLVERWRQFNWLE